MSEKNKPLALKEQLGQLDQIIAWFEQDDFDLDEALAKFETGMKLAETIKSRLAELENTVVILKKRFDEPGKTA